MIKFVVQRISWIKHPLLQRDYSLVLLLLFFFQWLGFWLESSSLFFVEYSIFQPHLSDQVQSFIFKPTVTLINQDFLPQSFRHQFADVHKFLRFFWIDAALKLLGNLVMHFKRQVLFHPVLKTYLLVMQHLMTQLNLSDGFEHIPFLLIVALYIKLCILQHLDVLDFLC